MTSLTTIGPEQQHVDGRSVREIVEHDPDQVNEVWCRKIFRQLLQSLELQYAMQMPHRAITPDTVVFHDNGEPLLLPSIVSDPYPDEGEDLTALARLIHFAITREIVPAGPLAGRALPGYSDSLVTAVDRCMDPDPEKRPHSIDELRNILGIVSLGAVPPAPASLGLGADDAPLMPPLPPSRPQRAPTPDGEPLPSFMLEDEAPRRAGLSRWQRWAVAAGGGALLLAIAVAVFAELRDSGSFDHIVLTLPQSGEGGAPQANGAPAASAPPAVLDAPAPVDGGTAQESAPPATDALAGAMASASEASAPDALPASAPGAPQATADTLPPARGARTAPNTGAAYKLQIQPWGVVYVDGVDRGVSPPVKRLVLAPGRHTIRVANPNFHDRVLEVDTARGDGRIAIDFRTDKP
jgi:hypothetical protein